MKKVLSALLALAIVFAFAMPAFAEDKIQIEYWNIANDSAGGAAVKTFIADFNEKNDKNIEVVSVHFSDYMAIAQSLQAALAAGEQPGVIAVGWSYLNYFAENFPLYTDPTTLADESYFKTKYNDAFFKLGVANDGSTLGLAYSASTPLLYYNADIFKAAGLDPENPPKTMEEVYEYGKIILEKTGITPLYIQCPADSYSIVPMFLSAGVKDMYVKDGKGYKTAFNTEEGVYAWTLLQNMYKEKVAVYMAHEEGFAAYAGGEVAMYISSSARANYLKNSVEFDSRATFEPPFEGHELKVCIGGNMLTIFAQDEKRVDACWEFVKYLLEPESVETWVKDAGYLPPTIDSYGDETSALWSFYEDSPMLQTALAEREFATQWTTWPGENGLEVEKHLVDMRDRIIAGNYEDPATVIAQTAATIDALIK